MSGRYKSLLLIVALFVSGIPLASAEEPPADAPPSEEDAQSRGIIGTSPRLPLTVQFAFRIDGAGRLDVAIGNETFSCS